jgi:hypothetical protein
MATSKHRDGRHIEKAAGLDRKHDGGHRGSRRSPDRARERCRSHVGNRAMSATLQAYFALQDIDLPQS